MKKGQEKSLSVEGLEHGKNEAMRKKVLFVEATFVVLLAISVDVIQLIPFYIGEVLAFPILAGVFTWTFIRGVHGRYLINIPLNIIDNATDGWLPLATIAILIVIWLNNHLEEETIKRITKVLGGHL